MRQLKTEAVILDSTPIFDADRSLLLFTREVGKVRARARGVRKPTSRLTGHLLPYVPVQLELVAGTGNFIVAQAQLLDAANATYPNDPVPFLTQASVLAEAVNKLFVENEPHQVIFDGLVYTLGRILDRCHAGTASQDMLSGMVAEFLFKCLIELGYQPELHQCVATGEPLNSAYVGWSNNLGGVLTKEGCAQTQDSIELATRTVVALREFAKPAFAAERLAMPEDIAQQTFAVVYGYVQYVVGQPLISLSSRLRQ